MKATIKAEKEFDIKYLKIDANVRYWQDSEINGIPDIDFMETEGIGVPRMPFAEKVKDKPETHIMSDHYRWKPTIDVDEGRIINWPIGTTANVCYKVCDEGIYYLLDKEMNEILKVESYVPDCIGTYGDYIEMNIDENGYIEDFSFDHDDVDNMIEE